MFESTTFLILITLAGVAVLALIIRPRGYFGHWRQLANQFETTTGPPSYSFRNQHIYVGYLSEPRLFWFPWQRRYWQMDDGEYAVFDAESSEEGLWLHHKGDILSKCPRNMFIPWEYLELRKSYSNQLVLRVATEYFVDFRMPKALGEACLRRMDAIGGY